MKGTYRRAAAPAATPTELDRQIVALHLKGLSEWAILLELRCKRRQVTDALNRPMIAYRAPRSAIEAANALLEKERQRRDKNAAAHREKTPAIEVPWRAPPTDRTLHPWAAVYELQKGGGA